LALEVCGSLPEHYDYGVALTGSVADVAAALNGIAGYTGNVTLSADVGSASAISAIVSLTSGTVSGAAVTDLTGTASAVVQALTDLDTGPTSFNVALAAGTASAANIATIKAVAGLGTLSGAAVTDLTGTASAIVQALTDLTTDPTSFNVVLAAGTASAANIATIKAAAGLGTLSGAAVTDLTGTASAVVQALTDLTTDPTNFNSTLTGSALAADITAIETANGNGTINGAAITGVSGSAAAVILALADLDVGGSTVAVTITDQPSLAQLKSINNATSGAITLSVTGGVLSGSAADLVAAFSGITSYTGNLTVTDQPTLAELVVINNATSGSITLNAVTSPLAGTASDLAAAFAGTITSYDGALTVTGNVSGSAGVTAINAIAAASAAAITTTGTLSGTSAQLANLTTTATDVVTISVTDTAGDSVAASTLSAIGGKTAGVVTVANAVAISGSVAQLKAALVTEDTKVGVSTASTVTVSDAADAAVLASEVKSIADLVSELTITNGVTLTGSESDITAVLGAATMSAADFNVTITGAISVDSSGSLLGLLSAVASSTSGDISIVGSGLSDTLNASTFTGSRGLTISGGNGADTITGTASADVLLGGAGNDTIIGGAGNDTVTLGTGTDTFRFNSLSGVDMFTDYTPSDDLIQLAKSVFTGLTTASGTLSSAEFVSGADLTAATTADQRIVHNTTNGALYYDADGSGATAAVQIAILTTPLTMTNSEFFIV